MGAQSFIHQIQGVDASSCFDALVEDADMCYGQRSYNGSINTCSMGRCRKKYDKYSKKNEKEAMDLIDKWNNGDKWVADYIDLGVTHYKAITFKKVLVKKPPKYKLLHAVKEVNYLNGMKVIKTFQTKTKADDYAIDLSIRNLEKEYCVTKEYVLLEGNKEVTRIEKSSKTYMSRPKLKGMPNRIIVPIRKYIFFGWASI